MNYTYIDNVVYGKEFEFLSVCASPYTGILGDYFYVIFGLISVWIIFLKSQDFILPLIIGLLFTTAFGFAFPENLSLAIIMLLGTGIGAAMYQVFKGRGD